MSLIRRVKRYLQAERLPQLAMVDRVGIDGEYYAGEFLRPPLVVTRIANPVLPHPNGSQLFLESDFLVYAAGTVFCVEIKNYRGIIFPAENYPSQIVQQKIGRYGEEIPAKWHRNPLQQAKGFIFRLKQYLAAHVNARFGNLYIVPVAAFVRNQDTDISRIWNPKHGIIYVDELPQFLCANGNPRFAAKPSRWLLDGLEKVPRADVMVTASGDIFRGFLIENHLVFKTFNGPEVRVPFGEILRVQLNRTGKFSDFDSALVTLRDGQQLPYAVIDGMVRFGPLQGRVMSKHLRNIVAIIPGRPIIKEA